MDLSLTNVSHLAFLLQLITNTFQDWLLQSLFSKECTRGMAQWAEVYGFIVKTIHLRSLATT